MSATPIAKPPAAARKPMPSVLAEVGKKMASISNRVAIFETGPAKGSKESSGKNKENDKVEIVVQGAAVKPKSKVESFLATKMGAEGEVGSVEGSKAKENANADPMKRRVNEVRHAWITA